MESSATFLKKDPMSIVKIILLVFIIISPFLDFKSIMWANSTPIKIFLLVGIVLFSFVDLQASILAMIAFLCLIINLNKEDLMKISITEEKIKEHMPRGEIILPMPSFNPEKEHFGNLGIHETLRETLRETLNEPEVTPVSQNAPLVQTVSDFPSPYCPGDQFESTQISESAFLYNVDEKTKPYEEYIRQLVPNSLEEIQSNKV